MAPLSWLGNAVRISGLKAATDQMSSSRQGFVGKAGSLQVNRQAGRQAGMHSKLCDGPINVFLARPIYPDNQRSRLHGLITYHTEERKVHRISNGTRRLEPRVFLKATQPKSNPNQRNPEEPEPEEPEPIPLCLRMYYA